MEHHISLGLLADPEQFHDPIDIKGHDLQALIKQLRTMLVIRCAEEIIGNMVAAGKVKCPCHLGIGQEAVAVGISAHLRPTDRVFGAHRSHSHFLALGASPYSLFAEVLGRATGCSRGMGGSMHLFDQAHGFLGSVPIVGASVPIATGAALAAKKDGRGDVAISYLGDSALEEGAVQESLNLAASMKLPIVFVVENNLFASHMHIALRQPTDATSRFGWSHRLNTLLVDGNDLVAVSKAAAIVVAYARAGSGPAFLEAVTYRWRGHVGPREDLDVGVQRKDDLDMWKGRDPVQRLVRALEIAGAFSKRAFTELHQQVWDELTIAWEEAERAPFPEPSAMLDVVYAKKTEG